MRLHTLTIRGIRPHYSAETRLDFDALPGPIVALVGPNGAGKSMLLGCAMGDLYREMPRGAGLADVALDRAAYMRADVETASGRYVITQTVDAVSGKGTSSVRRDGAELLTSGKVTEYDDWALRNLPPSGLVYASTFGAAKSVGILDSSLAPQDRRLILFRALGLEAVEPLPVLARAEAAALRAPVADAPRPRTMAGISAEIAAEERRADVAGARAAAKDALRDVESRACAYKAARDALDDARARHAALLAAWQDADAARKRHDEAAARAREAKRTLDGLVYRRSTAQATAADAARVRAYEAEIPAARLDVELAEANAGATERGLADAERAHQAALVEVTRARRELDDARAAEARGRADSRDLPAAEGAEARAEKARESLAADEAEHRRIQDEIERLNAATLDTAGRRIKGLRAGLYDCAGHIDGGLEEVRGIALRALDADDATALEAEAVPAALRKARAAAGVVTASILAARADLATAERLAARLPDLRAAKLRADEAATRVAEAEMSLRGRSEDGLRAGEAAAIARAVAAGSKSALDAARATLSRLERETRRLPEIARAETVLEELAPQIVAAEAALAAANAAIDAAPLPPVAEPVPALDVQEAAVRTAEEAHRRACGAVAVAEAALSDAEAAAARVAALRAELDALGQDVADWVRLESDLRAVLQHSIDAAGPEIASLTNELLRSPGCPSLNRYSVTVETQRPSADGKRQIEDCYVSVIDSTNGYAGASSGLSDGQLAVVGEAVRFALTRIACRTAGIASPTIVRDECAGALHADVVPQYCAMLRAGARLLGSDHVVVVTHDAALAALCDSRVRVESGSLAIE